MYAIMSIETSVGIICGCIPACRPLLSRMLPFLFIPNQSTNPTPRSKSTKISGKSFPFQSLSDGVARSDHGSMLRKNSAQAPGDDVELAVMAYLDAERRKRGDLDDVSSESEEWMMNVGDSKGGSWVDNKSPV